MISDHENYLPTSYSSLSKELRNKSSEFRYFRGMRYRSYVRDVGRDLKYGNGPIIVEKNQDFYFKNELKEEYRIFEGNSYTLNIKNRHQKRKYGFDYIVGGDEYHDYIYYDDYKGFRRLNIGLHGGISTEIGNESPFVSIGDYSYNHKKIIDIANRAAMDLDFDCLRLLICHSAEGGANSLISKVSHTLKKPVKGYIGSVISSAPTREVVKSGDHDAINEVLGRSTIAEYVFDVNGVARYARPGKTVMAGFEYF